MWWKVIPRVKGCLCVQACARFLTRPWRQEENSSTRCCAGGNERTASTKVSKWIWKSSISLPVAVSSSPPLIASQTVSVALCNPPRATPHLLGTLLCQGQSAGGATSWVLKGATISSQWEIFFSSPLCLTKPSKTITHVEEKEEHRFFAGKLIVNISFVWGC